MAPVLLLAVWLLSSVAPALLAVLARRPRVLLVLVPVPLVSPS